MTGSKKQRPEYVCGTYSRNGKIACERGGVRCDELELSVINWLKNRLGLSLDLRKLRKKVREDLVRRLLPSGMSDGEERKVDPVQGKLEAIEEKIAGYKRLRPAVLALCQDEVEAAMAERERLRAAIAAAPARTSMPHAACVDIEALTVKAMEYLAELARTLEYGTPPERRRFVGAFVTKVEVFSKDRQAKTYYVDPAEALTHSSSTAACRSSQNCTLRKVTIEC